MIAQILRDILAEVDSIGIDNDLITVWHHGPLAHIAVEPGDFEDDDNLRKRLFELLRIIKERKRPARRHRRKRPEQSKDGTC